MYDALFDTLVSLLSQFMSQQIVTQYKNSEISDDEIRILVNDEENHLSRNHLYVGFIVKTQVKKLLDDGDITKIRYDMVFNVCLIFHVFLYVLENFLVNNNSLKHARVFNFLDQKGSFESVQFLTKELKSYVTFTFEEFLQMDSVWSVICESQFFFENPIFKMKFTTQISKYKLWYYWYGLKCFDWLFFQEVKKIFWLKY